MIGVISIGHAPRPDLTDPLRNLSPHLDIREFGALDGLTPSDLPSSQDVSYPLVTQLRDGSVVTVGQSFLVPRLQEAIWRSEAAGAVANLILCAGTFPGLKHNRPLLIPFQLVHHTLTSLNITTIAVVAPFPNQVPPIQERWKAAGYKTTVWAAELQYLQTSEGSDSLKSHVAKSAAEVVVLDYVGHSLVDVRAVRALSPLPVFDLGQTSFHLLSALMEENHHES